MSNESAELGRCEEPKITAARYAGQRRSALTDLHLPPKFPASPNRISGAEDQVREEGDASGAHALPDESGTTLGATHGAQARPGSQVSGPGHRGLPRRRPAARPGRPQGAHPRQQRGAAQVPIGGGGEEAQQDLRRSQTPHPRRGAQASATQPSPICITSATSAYLRWWYGLSRNTSW